MTGVTGQPVERVAFLAPMPSEIKPLVKRLRLQKRTLGDGEVDADAIYEGRHGDVEVVATISGIGMAAATRAAHRLLDEGRIDHLIVIGVAGGIGHGIAVGDVVVPAVVIDVETGTEHRPAHLGATVADGRLLTSDEFIKDVERLGAFRDDGAAAIDMETFAVAAVCVERECTWSVFRGISDDAFDASINAEILAMANPDGTPNKAAVAKFVAKNPTKVTFLAKLGKGLNQATTGAVDAALQSVTDHNASRD
jgi:adenosylhomocysteine nucleosidase